MNRYDPVFISFRRWAIALVGLLLIAFGGFYFLQVSAKTEKPRENPAEQNLVNGRLAFSYRLVGPTVPNGSIITSNPDGSGQTLLGTASLVPSQPAWSPDGTKIAFASTQPPFDIYAINANGGGETNLTNTPDSIVESNPSWSVTGKIAYERRPFQSTASQIWTMNADGSGQAQFSAITQPLPTGPAWSPDGTRLAFASGGEIWVINADGTNERRVTMNTSNDIDPAWSPDGSKIVFAKGGAGITVINADGTNETPLTSGGIQPSWSPDGTKIAYRVNGIYTMDANGANQVRIVADTSNFPQCCDVPYEHPAWQPVAQTPSTFTISGRVTYGTLAVAGATVNLSGTTNAAATTDAVGNYQFPNLPAGGSYTVSPSFPRHYFTPPNRSFNNLASNQTGDFEVLGVCPGGRCVKNGKIAFVRDSEIWTMNPDGSNQTNITNNAANDGEPNYSPDGSKIIFSTSRDGNTEIYRMNADGTNPVRLTSNPAADFAPYYSPDGASIVFVSDRDGNNEIYKMNADGSNQVRLTNDAASQGSPAFSPDGRKIIFITAAFQSPMWLMTMNADGSNQQQFLSGTFLNRPSYSPDGSKIIFVYGIDVTAQTIYTVNADGTNFQQFHTGRSSPTYSPDGIKVAHACCFFSGGPNPNGIFVSNVSGGFRQITTGQFDGYPDWQGFLVPRAPFDFDGDGRSDISVFRPSDATWYLNRSTAGFLGQQWGVSDDVIVPADYDGDLKTDIAVWRPADGNYYILNSFSNTLRGENFGLAGDVPTGGDWDGDGKADPAVYRPGTQSYFYYRGSMGNPQRHITAIQFGASGDKPVAGDYDGDAKTDAAVFRPSNGTWYMLGSQAGFTAVQFGVASDKPVVGDYDGDGKADAAVYRSGTWYLLRSSQGFAAVQFGAATDLPVAADYDGDGKTDLGVYRENTWYLLQSTGGFAGLQFGAIGDKPVPNAFVR